MAVLKGANGKNTSFFPPLIQNSTPPPQTLEQSLNFDIAFFLSRPLESIWALHADRFISPLLILKMLSSVCMCMFSPRGQNALAPHRSVPGDPNCALPGREGQAIPQQGFPDSPGPRILHPHS